ncbi:Nuclear fragile X mental retardation-interacting protein 1 [Rhodotorula toruloides]|nr:Nuclear fragile X mental retardation-interacting protein 1 [Rhodotorula toruloides]
MSYNSGGQQPRRTAPLIQRPASSQHPHQSQSTLASGLGNAVSGALGGMGYGQTAMGGVNWGPYGGQAFAPAGGAVQSYGQSWAGQYGGMGGFSGGGGPALQSNGAGQPYGGPAQYSQAPRSAYPPSFYPPSHDQRQQRPPALPQRPFASSSAPQHYPEPRPQTTVDGYSLSSAYAGPSASSTPSYDSPVPSASTERDSTSRKGRKGGPSQPSGGGPQIVKCCKDDCSFTGSKKQVREHEEDRHLIYAPGREPKPWSGSLKPVDGAVIEGTGIALDTPEAVAKWIEERKKRWPSKKVVEEKEKARAERIAAGLEAPPRERGGRGRGRGRGQAEPRGRGRGRGGRGGFVGGREGGEAQQDEEDKADEPARKRVKLEMEEETAEVKTSVQTDVSDGSDSDDEDDGPPEEATTKIEAMDAEMHDEEVVKERGAGAEQVGEEEFVDTSAEGAAAEAPKNRFQVVCRHWRKGNCALGDDCPYLHEIPANAPPPPLPKRKRPAPPPPPHNPFARPAGYSDPFSLLEERDYKHLVSDVLQVIEFLGANDWLKGVEIRPGQLDEESGIEVLEDKKTEERISTEEAVVEPEVKPEVEDDSDDDDLVITPIGEQVAPIDVTPSAHPATFDGAHPPQPPPAAGLPTPSLPLKPALSSALASLVADYGSDTDDEEEEQSVAAALTGRA